VYIFLLPYIHNMVINAKIVMVA